MLHVAILSPCFFFSFDLIKACKNSSINEDMIFFPSDQNKGMNIQH